MRKNIRVDSDANVQKKAPKFGVTMPLLGAFYSGPRQN